MWLGKISYVLYLIHQNVGYVIISKLEVLGGANSVTVILIPLAVSICVSIVIHRLVEVPARQRIKGAYLNYVARES